MLEKIPVETIIYLVLGFGLLIVVGAFIMELVKEGAKRGAAKIFKGGKRQDDTLTVGEFEIRCKENRDACGKDRAEEVECRNAEIKAINTDIKAICKVLKLWAMASPDLQQSIKDEIAGSL